MPVTDHANPEDLPPHRLECCITARREPGMMLFNVRGDLVAGEGSGYSGWLLGVDQSGRISCLHRSHQQVQGVRVKPDGNLLVTVVDGLVMEMNLSGDILRQWYATGRFRDRPPPADAIPVEAETFHHGVNLGPDGNMLLLSMEIREYDDLHGSVTDPSAPRERAKLVGDIIMEVRPDGSRVNEWRLLDMLDPRRITYGSRDTYWIQRGYAEAHDWCHANGTAYVASDDSILVSLRTQDCIIKFDRKSGALRWILGDHGNWKAPWSEKLLTPDGPLSWQFHQHDCSVTPAGTILCFDNGNHRALPFECGIPPEDNFSRAVEFAVDDASGTVREVWSYGAGAGERLFAGFQGGAFRLPNTGNTFINYGGICSLDGKPANEPDGANNIRARLIEVTLDREIVFDMRLGGGPYDPKALSIFRSEFIAPSGAASGL